MEPPPADPPPAPSDVPTSNTPIDASDAPIGSTTSVTTSGTSGASDPPTAPPDVPVASESPTAPSGASAVSAQEDDAELPTTVPSFKRGWAKGAREVFFQDRTSGYTQARSRGTRITNDFLITVLNDYCSMFTWWLEPPSEPTAEDLAKEDSDLDADTLALKPAKLKRLRKGIRNIFDRFSAGDSPFAKMTVGQVKKDPVGSLIASIAKPTVDIPRARTAYQLWSKRAFRANVKDSVNKTVAEEGLNSKTERIDVVAGSTKEAFLALPQSEREAWELKAEAEKKANSEQRQRIKENGGLIPQPMMDPTAAQEVLDTMVLKLDPLLKSLARITGGNCHFYWAGPEPARGGQVNVISIHAGTDKSTIPRDFMEAGGSEAAARRRLADAIFGDFALNCFNPRDQAVRCHPDLAPCTAPPTFLRYRPVSWEAAAASAPSVNTAPPTMTQQAPTPNGVPSPGAAQLSSLPTTTGKRKTTDTMSKPRKKRGSQHASDEFDETDEDVPQMKDPWDIEDDGSGEDEHPSAHHEPGTRASHRISARTSSQQQTLPNTAITMSAATPRPAGPAVNIEPVVATPPVVTGENPTVSAEPMVATSSANSTGTVDNDEQNGTPMEFQESNEQQPADVPMDDMNIAPSEPEVAQPESAEASKTKSVTRASRRNPPAAKKPTKTRQSGKASENSSNTPHEYLNHVRPMFAMVNDDIWNELVALFVRYETGHDSTDARLAPGHRPDVILTWVRSRRPQLLDGVLPTKMPETVTLAKGVFWSWWRCLQPPWRNLRQSNKPITSSDRRITGDDWSRLDANGINGLVNVMVYLLMWGLKVKEDGSGLAAWHEAIRDVQWTFEQMLGEKDTN
ncbi:hypothetical protein CYLTODRAFT_442968 [Cylindrobasidium torrendii FP15055 ss-10]|uniref:Uncharacterized protein n=1 Tax=Cylindrobasidium torrendii FP15055 ss-10 TaxID=1314674 RepID=A0A0D7BEM2_9AGAR|nr:hypothetical protein CYLTODRAFT_442968 [Cylindrobasidium torrendii FP15055 ss-10]